MCTTPTPRVGATRKGETAPPLHEVPDHSLLDLSFGEERERTDTGDGREASGGEKQKVSTSGGKRSSATTDSSGRCSYAAQAKRSYVGTSTGITQDNLSARCSSASHSSNQKVVRRSSANQEELNLPKPSSDTYRAILTQKNFQSKATQLQEGGGGSMRAKTLADSTTPQTKELISAT